MQKGWIRGKGGVGETGEGTDALRTRGRWEEG